MINTSLIGRLCADPETKTLDKGTVITTVRVAADTFARGEKRTTFLRAAIFGKRGETLAAHTKKGDQVFLTGNLYVDEYESKGEKRYSVELVNADFDFVAGQKKAEDKGADEALPF